jgi:hypothetical protein
MDVVRHHDVLVQIDTGIPVRDLTQPSEDETSEPVQEHGAVAHHAEHRATAARADGDEIRVPRAVREVPESGLVPPRHDTTIAGKA